jgi:CBS domain-containing membrane protein
MSNSEKPLGNVKSERRFRLFAPILAGATLRERMVACLGVLIALVLTGWISALILGPGSHLPAIIAPIGASAVLLFVIPASPLAQPWPLIGGNMISTLVGMAIANLIPDPVVAAGIAGALAIIVMSLLRCLHPPGAGLALSAALGGPVITAAGFSYHLVPVALNSVILMILGLGFHKLSRRAYPHVPAPAPVNTHKTLDVPAQLRVGFRAEDVDAALETLDQTFDIDRDDLDALLRQVETQALMRSHADLLCEHIMSRDLVHVNEDASPDTARVLLLEHNIRTLPVVDDNGKLVGAVGLRELTLEAERVADLISPAATASPGDRAAKLLPLLTDGRTHAVIIVDVGRKVLGLITQTDLLVALGRGGAGILSAAAP